MTQSLFIYADGQSGLMLKLSLYYVILGERVSWQDAMHSTIWVFAPFHQQLESRLLD
jgi:hypothetical protein